MRIIHAADLHLGRSFHERDLGPDQAHMLEVLGRAIVEREADVLLLAGDIYDRAIPAPEAIALFDGFLSAAKAARPGLAIVAIPGNHDSATRLSFGADLLSFAGVHLRTRPEEVTEPIIVEKGGRRLAIWALPYLNPGAFSGSAVPAPVPARETGREERPAVPGELPFDTEPADAATTATTATTAVSAAGGAVAGAAGPPGLRSQSELFSEAIARVRPLLDPESHNVLLAHCFATGCAPSESERAFVGAAEEVSLALFEPFDYVALGHLHRRQAAGPKARYPGSPLAYSFAEAEAAPEKGFLLVELGEEGFTETFLPVEPLHRARRLEGRFAELSAPGAHAAFREDFIEARLTDETVVLDPSDPLRANFPNLLSVRQAALELAFRARSESPEARCRGEGTGAGAVMEDFRAFHAELLGAGPDAATEAAFAALLEEASHASA